MALIRELGDRDQVKISVVVREKQLLHDKNGRPYLNLQVADKSGSINARAWDKAEAWDRQFAAGDVIRLHGQVQIYQKRKQIIVREIFNMSPDEAKASDLFPGPRHSPDEVLSRLESRTAEVRSEPLKILLQKTFADAEVRSLLREAPAARSIHHAYPGGLLDHVWSMVRILDFLGNHYKFLDADLLFFGAVYHDLGKIWELSISDEINYTRRGRLVGHMELACERIDHYVQQIPDFPLELRDVLKHIILSHHGRLEYGSPKRPKFLEALLVALVDEMDSRMDSVHQLMEEELGADSSWTRYDSFYDRYFFLDILRNLNASTQG